MTKTFFFLLILSPLLYSFSLPELREEEVLAVAAAAAMFFVISMQKRLLISNPREIVIVALFSLLAIAQQYFIADGSPIFGIKYALVLLATFVPYWIARTLGTRTPGLGWTVALAFGLLLLITVFTVFASYLFGKGEVHEQPGGVVRAFGWLGDSFSPVIVFFVFYYFFQKKYLVTGLALATLLMTVAKAAIVMLIVSPLIFVLVTADLKKRIAFAGFYLVLVLSLIPFAATIFEKMTDLFQVDYSYYTRLLSARVGLEYFFSAPAVGIGVNRSWVNIEGDALEYAHMLGVEVYFNVYKIDNTIIRTAAETGVLGLALLLLLLYVLLSAAFRALRTGEQLANPQERAIVLASSLWVIGFVLFYQTTGWLEAGHPQLCWLLLFSTLSDVFCRRCRTQMGLPSQVRYQWVPRDGSRIT